MNRRPDLGAILALLALIMLLGVVAGIEALPDDLHLDTGDLATWFSGVATAAVALLAWRTAHRAATTAQAALRDQQRDEAEKITWWLEDDFLSSDEGEPTPVDFDPPPGLLPWEHVPPEETMYSGTAILRVLNGGQVLVGGARALIWRDRHIHEYSAGLKAIGVLRPGVTRFRIHLESTGGSAGGNWTLSRDLYQNRLVDWLEFTDSGGRIWRRHANGRLEELLAQHGSGY